VANVIGLRVRLPGVDSDDGGAQEKLIGPLHAVEGTAGRAAAADCREVRALCGEWVQVVPVEDAPNDAELCPACLNGG
jgi:hypothetical protein